MVKVENLTMDPVPDVSFEVGPVSESARGEARPKPRETGLSGHRSGTSRSSRHTKPVA